MRILQFITPSGFYGAERWVLALANNIDQDNIICDLAVTQESDKQDLTVAELYPREAGEVHYLSMSGRFDIQVVDSLVKVIKDRQIEIVHTHGYKSDILGLIAARRAGVKCLSTPHGFSGDVGFKLKAFIRMGTFMLRYFDAVAPLSEELVDNMADFKVPARKVHFIRNGVDLNEIELSRDMGSEAPPSVVADDRVVGFVGQLIPRKGISELLEVFDGLHRDDPALKLQILGDGRQRAELEAQAAAMPSADAIDFLGFRPDRLELVSRFSLFVMTSTLEGIPRCLMEAMALGVPVAAYDIPGVDQLIEHEVTGLLAPLGDQRALKDCCRRLLEDPELAGKLVKAAREKIESTYSSRRMASEYQSLFAHLTGRNSVASVRSADGAG
ncbi:glycosyltransferase family 4 protein [Marinobacter sp. M1N3S26]|uniref:glycosyltransferase family 4 protein n=1 Tax=unclassified Marinobacter TaxID=83889 RepID=UPI00387B16D0